MNIHNINTIARYEVKLLRRSWLFRIFAILALLGITVMLLGQQTNVFSKYNEIWSGVALSSMLPFIGIYFYNIAQSVIVIFLAGSFLKRDRKLDTAEVIYVRPMSNADYIIGKTWGIMKVFIILNIISLIIISFINLFITRSPFSIFPYLFYLVTISIPSLLFILGLSFTVMCLLKNQAVTFIVMLGIIGLVFFYLTESLNGVFDFFGVNIPGIFSDVTGHADIRLFLLQRFIYLLAGIGLISFTISLVKRLPHRPWKIIIVNTIGVVFVLAGCCAGVLYVLHYRNIAHLRGEYALSYNEFADKAKVNTLSHHITIEPLGREMEAQSVIRVRNNNPEKSDKIILYLNPGLTVSAIGNDKTDLSFTRENQVIVINREIAAGEEPTLTLSYKGHIDENVCYTDVEEKELSDTKIPDVYYRFGKRYAYLDDTYTLLTPECLWYPVSVPPANPKALYNIKKNFTDYSLSVIAPNGKTILSQGEKTQAENKTVFKNRTPLDGISLTIADYDKKSVTVDSVDYELYYFKGHDFFSKYFTELTDTLPAMIREMKNDQEIAKSHHYPFRKFVLAETPVHFASYVRNWKGYTEYIMPEIIFMPERGATINADFQALKNRFQDWRHGEEGLPDEKEIQMNMFRDFFQNTFISENRQQGWKWDQQTVNKFNLSPLFFNHSNFIYSETYPVIDIAVNTMLNASTVTQRGWWGSVINNQQRANLYLENKSLKSASEDVSIKAEIFYELLKLKSNALKNYITAQVSDEDFTAFLKDFFNRHQFTEIEFDDFTRQFSERFDIDLSEFVRDWYLSDRSPTLFIKDVDANQVVVDDFTKYQIRFKVNNPSDVAAILSVNIQEGGGGRGGRRGGRGAARDNQNKPMNYIIPAKTAGEIKIIVDERPANVTINTNISHNLPTSHTYNFAKIDNVIQDTTSGISAIPTSLFATNPTEIIVDNESENFQVIESNSRQKLKELFRKEEDEKYKNFMPWRFPSKWTTFVGDYCYGETVNSAIYKTKGNGANSVIWSASIPVEGYYDVSVWNAKMSGFSISMRRRHRGQEDRAQTYLIKYGHEKEDFIIDLEQENEGWVSVGNFYLPQGTTTITLTDKVSGNYVIADAVKFTKVEE